jgi:N-dimethylarginine dimethylaminohydrolase
MSGKVDKALAQKQWDALKSAIENEGVKVMTLDQAPDVPDMVFVCNSGLVLDNKVYLSSFCHPQRRGEQAHYLRWFRENNFELYGLDYPEFFEGSLIYKCLISRITLIRHL